MDVWSMGRLVNRRLVDRTFRRQKFGQQDILSTDVSSKGLLVERMFRRLFFHERHFMLILFDTPNAQPRTI